MAISIDRVYQKVLALANKEQRGYITPQEFNLFADHAQMDIFEQYFYDLEKSTRSIPSSTEFADETTNLDEKMSLFERYSVSVAIINVWGDIVMSGLNIYRLGAIRVNFAADGVTGHVKAEQISVSDLDKHDNPLTNSRTLAGPYFLKYYAYSNELRVKIYPYPNMNTDTVLANYIEKPSTPNWTYLITNTGAALYNPGFHEDFQLHASEENRLVIKILQLAGISIKDYQLTGLAVQEEAKKIQEKNQ